MTYDQPLRINTGANRLELDVDGIMAFIDFKLSHQQLFLIHTEVPAELEGKGVGKAIVEKALQYAKDNDFKIIPICPFIQSYLKRHPGWNDLVSPDAGRFMQKK